MEELVERIEAAGRAKMERNRKRGRVLT